MQYKPIRAIVSGGGTGGHIFPAISIANQLMQCNPQTEILFVGAEGKMEMEKVPAAGYRIVGLPIVGMQRKLTLKNIANDLLIPFKVASSIRRARRIIRDFKPDVVVGVGGYASAPLLWAATGMHIPAVIQEQNGFAGLTNKLLGSRVQSICVAYEGMERFFPKEKIVMSGNPIRKELSAPASPGLKEEALQYFGFHPEKKHLLIVGGSLGSGTLNQAMQHWIQDGCPDGGNLEIIWQCGRYYKEKTEAFLAAHPERPLIRLYDFIGRMDLAFAAADVVISRSGASTVSEICAMGKATIFVPSPNVAEDHQTHNAMALVRRGAALLVKDSEAIDDLLPTAIGLLHSPDKRAQLEKNALSMALCNASQVIADEIYKLV